MGRDGYGTLWVFPETELPRFVQLGGRKEDILKTFAPPRQTTSA
jgi:hypothetical protein